MATCPVFAYCPFLKTNSITVACFIKKYFATIFTMNAVQLIILQHFPYIAYLPISFLKIYIDFSPGKKSITFLCFLTSMG